MALAIYCLLGLNLAVGRNFPWSYLPGASGAALWLVFSAGLLGLMFSRRLAAGFEAFFVSRVFASRRLWPAALVVANAAFCGLNAWHFARFGYRAPWLQWAACAAVLPWIRRDRLGLSVALSVFLLAASTFYFPLDPARSDMLPAIAEAWKNWREGLSPYAALTLSSGPDTMPYLPGVFFSHYFAQALRVDLRWGEAFYRLLWMGWLARRASRLPPASPWRGVAQLLMLSPYLAFRHELYFEFFCLLLCAYSFAPRLRTVLLPLVVVTRQWGWVLAPFLVLRQARQRGWLRTVAELALTSSLVLGAVVAALRSTTGLGQFVRSVLVFQGRVSLPAYPGDLGLTFAPALYALRLSAFAQPLQGAVVLACLVFAWARPGDVSRWGIRAWVLFLLLNYHFWIYFWLSPLVWMVAEGIAQSELLDGPVFRSTTGAAELPNSI